MPFSTEIVTRAVAASRTPTVVAIGHEVDVCLAELAADVRASTPSNAAELLVPSKTEALNLLVHDKERLHQIIDSRLVALRQENQDDLTLINDRFNQVIMAISTALNNYKKLLIALNPEAILRRGYAIVRSGNSIIRSLSEVASGQKLNIQISQGKFDAIVSNIQAKEK
ncbi:MAG: hypothetical protein NVS1B10_01150 [Candidatus Saccharimonadales bacterium]